MKLSRKPLSVSFRMATKDDTHLESYDNTKLTAGATCPTWGVLRYQMHKSMYAPSRALPLECGSVMHDAFAFVRLVQLYYDYLNDSSRDMEVGKALFHYHGKRLFNTEDFPKRWDDILQDAEGPDKATIEADHLLYAKRGCVAVINTSTYYDDPSDKKRTITNMESSILAYCENWNWKPKVWVRDVTDEKSDIGVENPFDLVVEWEFADDGGMPGYPFSPDDIPEPSTYKVARRFIGKIDGIRVYNGEIRLEENKTAARLNDAWSEPFNINSQPTGYTVATRVFTGEHVERAKIMGLCIPLPKSYDYGGILEPVVRREDRHIKKWLEWFDFIASMYEEFKDNPFDAPMFTHSCGRYFRMCMMQPFCDSDRAEQEQMVTEMATDKWSPLEAEGGSSD